jgi:hypothetical protein
MERQGRQVPGRTEIIIIVVVESDTCLQIAAQHSYTCLKSVCDALDG